MTRLSSFFCSKWLSPTKMFFGVFPKQLFTLFPQSPAVSLQMAVASEKVLWRVPPTTLYICLPNGCCFTKILWRVPPSVLYIPDLLYLPVSSWGQSCVKKLTCLTHTVLQSAKKTHHVVAVGVFFGFIFRPIFGGGPLLMTGIRADPATLKDMNSFPGG